MKLAISKKLAAPQQYFCQTYLIFVMCMQYIMHCAVLLYERTAVIRYTPSWCDMSRINDVLKKTLLKEPGVNRALRLMLEVFVKWIQLYRILQWGAVHKRRPHKIAKNWSPSPLVRTGLSPSSCLCGHTINFEKSEVFALKSADVRIWRTLVCKMFALDNPPTAGIFYGRPLSCAISCKPKGCWCKSRNFRSPNWEVNGTLGAERESPQHLASFENMLLK